jgi:hypothetical protein
VAGAEAVVVHVVGQQAADLGVHAVPELGRGDDAASSYGALEVLVVRDLVLDADRARGHAALPVHGVRIGGETGPEHDAVVLRIA